MNKYLNLYLENRIPHLARNNYYCGITNDLERCLGNQVPYNIFQKWYKGTRNKIVKVKVDGIPMEHIIEKKRKLLRRETFSRLS